MFTHIQALLPARITSPNDATDRSWLNPRSRCVNLVHFRRLSTFANLFRLRSRVSTAGRSCNDSSIRIKPLHAQDTNDSLFHWGDSFMSAILLANTWRNASWNSTERKEIRSPCMTVKAPAYFADQNWAERRGNNQNKSKNKVSKETIKKETTKMYSYSSFSTWNNIWGIKTSFHSMFSVECPAWISNASALKNMYLFSLIFNTARRLPISMFQRRRS